MFQEFAGPGGWITGDDNPDAGGHREAETVLRHGLADRSHDPLGEQARVVGVAQGAEHHELVAAETGDGVGPPQGAREPPGHLDEHLVAGLMPERVVDHLEVVEVDEQQGYATGAALQGQEGLGKPVHECGPVGQACHRVVQRLVGEGLLRLDLGGYVPRDAKGADDGSVVVSKGNLAGLHPGVRTVAEGLSLDLSKNRLAGSDDALLILEGGNGVGLAEDIEVRLAEEIRLGQPRGVVEHVPVAQKQETTVEIFEVDALTGIVEQVVHAQTHEFFSRTVSTCQKVA